MRASTGTLYLLLVSTLACWGTTGLAAEWSLVPSMSTKGYYNDNLLLTQSPHSSTYGYVVSPATEFAGKTEQLEVSGKAALDFVDYYGGETTRFTNIFLPITARYRTERDEWGFTGGFTRDNTLMGELQTTGVVLRFTQRNLWAVNPTWTRMLTERLSFQGTFQFNLASYEDGLRLGLLDYKTYGGSAGILYHITEQDDLLLSGTYTNFTTSNAPFGLRASFPGVMLTFNHTFTESLKGTAYGGPRFISSTSRFAGGELTTQDSIWVFGAGLTKQFDSASIQATISREVFPSGFGLLLQTDRIGLAASYSLSETVTAFVGTSAYTVSGATTRAQGGKLSDQKLFFITPGVSWKFSEWWKAEASYTYGWREVENFGDPVMANTVMLTLTYYPPKLSISN